MDHQKMMDLARKGLLSQKQEDYQALLAQIDTHLHGIQMATTMLLPGHLDDVKEDQAYQSIIRLKEILPKARQLKKELLEAGIYVW